MYRAFVKPFARTTDYTFAIIASVFPADIIDKRLGVPPDNSDKRVSIESRALATTAFAFFAYALAQGALIQLEIMPLR